MPLNAPAHKVQGRDASCNVVGVMHVSVVWGFESGLTITKEVRRFGIM
jgi:hypothetical protein